MKKDTFLISKTYFVVFLTIFVYFCLIYTEIDTYSNITKQSKDEKREKKCPKFSLYNFSLFYKEILKHYKTNKIIKKFLIYIDIYASKGMRTSPHKTFIINITKNLKFEKIKIRPGRPCTTVRFGRGQTVHKHIWEIVTWEVALVKMPMEKYLTAAFHHFQSFKVQIPTTAKFLNISPPPTPLLIQTLEISKYQI